MVASFARSYEVSLTLCLAIKSRLSIADDPLAGRSRIHGSKPVPGCTDSLSELRIWLLVKDDDTFVRVFDNDFFIDIGIGRADR